MSRDFASRAHIVDISDRASRAHIVDIAIVLRENTLSTSAIVPHEAFFTFTLESGSVVYLPAKTAVAIVPQERSLLTAAIVPHEAIFTSESGLAGAVRHQ